MIPVRLVIATLDDAGAERQLVALASGLDRRRFAPSVICLTRGGPHEAALRAADIPCEVLGKRGPVDPVALARLARRLGTPGIVHTWMFTANAYGRAAALLAGAGPLVASERSEDPWKGRSRLTLDRWLAGRTAAVVANAEAVADWYRARLPGARIAVIPNGFVPRPGSPEPLALGPGRWIAAVGRLAPQKGFDVLLRALPAIRRSVPDAGVAIAGKGHAHLEAPGLRLLGHIPDPRALLASASAFAMPSRFEGMPNALMEAMDAGLPCVATRVGGCAELLGDAGWLVPPEDPAALAAALVEAILSPRGRGERARLRLSERFPLDRMVRAYEDLYERLVAPEWAA